MKSAQLGCLDATELEINQETIQVEEGNNSSSEEPAPDSATQAQVDKDYFSSYEDLEVYVYLKNFRD